MITSNLIVDKSVSKFESDIKEEARATLAKKVDKINRHGPTILREALRTTLQGDPRTAKYSYLFKGNKYIKAENRPISNPKVGSGLKMRFEENVLQIRLILTQNVLKEGYWPLIIAQYGRKRLPKRSREQGPYVMGIHQSEIYRMEVAKPYEPRMPNRRSLSGDYFAVFTYGPIAGVSAYYNWVDKGKKLAEDEFLRYARGKL